VCKEIVPIEEIVGFQKTYSILELELSHLIKYIVHACKHNYFNILIRLFETNPSIFLHNPCGWARKRGSKARNHGFEHPYERHSTSSPFPRSLREGRPG